MDNLGAVDWKGLRDALDTGIGLIVIAAGIVWVIAFWWFLGHG